MTTDDIENDNDVSEEYKNATAYLGATFKDIFDNYITVFNQKNLRNPNFFVHTLSGFLFDYILSSIEYEEIDKLFAHLKNVVILRIDAGIKQFGTKNLRELKQKMMDSIANKHEGTLQ